ncbi:site-specific DNA-methyltransferase [Corynebacterium timonense]|uniref:Site-specific DNA-methyltransferase (Adenine-specific) n=1 Tax=Corynebacterium timonense TaxID=441500 RepID=A0A1H1R5J3_9CORY|nr:site-specific DNA-methyltransferase [Corynebacterium timonense]SDS30786.1 site-specific DNA-methyltransferase (adenine-specific) [Corynebacterium timonense]
MTWFNKDKALIPSEEGRYAYEWVDPKDPRYCETRTLVVNEVVTGAQSPKEDGTQYSERADLVPTDDNLLILGESGDVLEALTRVPELREKYLGKVKCIYIDPPFNTAQTFANYEDNLEHSVWLTMMRDRLVHLRKLLSDDGSIWVHLDDVENHRMRVLMDEMFGSGNFVAEVVWQKAYSPRNDASGFSVDQDVIIVYSKTSGWQSNKLPRLASRDALYTSPDGDSRVWISDNPAAPHSVDKSGRQVSAVYGVQNPVTGEMIYPAKNRQWGKNRADFHEWLNETTQYRDEWSPDLDERSRATGIPIDQLRSDVPDLVVDGPLLKISEGESLYGSSPLPRLYFTDGGRGGLKLKRYLDEISQTRAPQTLWLHEDVGHNRTSKAEMNSLFPENAAFATPKPERLLERVIHIATNPGDVVLDVFAGSGTTAAVAQKMGRRWVTCELIEDTFNRFTRPRLEKVVNDGDQGGISIQRPERIDATEEGLPEGLSPEDAQKFNSALNKVLAANPELKTEAVVKALKAATKTKNQKGVVNWRGGGGFAVAHLAPQCFDYVPELCLVTLTEAATGATLVNSVAANLNFSLTPDNRHFDGKRGSMFLKVVEGRLDKDKAEELLAHLNEGEGVTFAATELEPGVRQFARTTDRPCQIVHIPNDIFTYSATQEGK